MSERPLSLVSIQSSARNRAWRDDEIAILGTVTDGQLAILLGRSRASVILKRTRIGIPPFMAPGRPSLSAKPAGT